MNKGKGKGKEQKRKEKALCREWGYMHKNSHTTPTPTQPNPISNPIQSNPVFLRKLLDSFLFLILFLAQSLTFPPYLYCIVLKCCSPIPPPSHSFPFPSLAIRKQMKRHQGDPGRSHAPQRPPEITTRF